jgi:Dirigent-like protein
VASSLDGSSQTLALTTMFKAGEYSDSISFFGVHRTIDSESHLAIVGGTGKYVNAHGFAKVAVVRSAATQHETDGVETVLQFSVFLAY